MSPDDLRDLFASFGPVTVRRMFSGAGVFRDGLMFALFAREVLYLKADVQTIPAFMIEGCACFTYATRNGERSLGSYWRMPDRLYDDMDELAIWAAGAFAAAQRAELAKAKRPTARPSSGAKRPSAPRRRPSSRGRSRK